MLVVMVSTHVKPEFVEAFKEVTIDNARNSIQEPGVLRFDVYQQNEDHTRFTMVEIYKSADDPPKHRETAHYLRWRDAVANMLAEPRGRVEYQVIYPPAAEW